MGDSDLQAWEAFFTAAGDPCFLIQIGEKNSFTWARVNDAWECATGIPRGHVIGKDAHAHLPPSAAEAAINRMAECVRLQTPLDFEGEVEFPTGKRVWHTRLVPWTVGGRVYLAGFARDVSDRVAADRHRGLLETQLVEAQKLESLGVLAGGIAHDFNNLLTGILANVSLMRLSLPETSELREHTDQIESVTLRAADLCRQLLAYSGRGRFVVAPLDASDLVRDTAQLLKLSMGKSAVLRLNLAAGLPPVAADATQIRQALMNLVLNAAESLGNRVGHVTVTTGLERADSEALRSTFLAPELPGGEYVFLEVVDDGCGIGAELQSKIFDPFFSTKFTGRGLGLSAVLGIVRGHRGALKLSSELGRGTTLRLLFPAVTARVEPSPVSRSPLPSRGTVLVVDDEDAVRVVAARILRSSGFDVITASDGREGLALFHEHHEVIVAVLMDLTMPAMDGVEALREIRALNARVPVVLMSGYNEQDAVDRFAGSGLSGFLQKPFTVEMLRDRLLGVLS